ncbi:hypothetical protein ACN47E_000840 [Coniothyrium glycines]
MAKRLVIAAKRRRRQISDLGASLVAPRNVASISLGYSKRLSVITPRYATAESWVMPSKAISGYKDTVRYGLTSVERLTGVEYTTKNDRVH